MKKINTFMDYIEAHSWDSIDNGKTVVSVSEVKNGFKKYIIPILDNIDNIYECMKLIKNNLEDIEKDIDIEIWQNNI